MKIHHLLILSLIAILSAGRMTVSTRGNYTLHSGRTLRGDLIITSGETTLEDGSRVTGNVIMTSGTEISVPQAGTLSANAPGAD